MEFTTIDTRAVELLRSLGFPPDRSTPIGRDAVRTYYSYSYTDPSPRLQQLLALADEGVLCAPSSLPRK